jgi:2-polyprenyl-3-methyl-5-hydroxy-6-metoxy-1,4-benzoquinol methylase
MAIGYFIRQLLGPLESPISNFYRSVFIDITAFVSCIQKWIPEANNIIELGCGEGAITERLIQTYKNACITGIDISPQVGRMYRGDRSRVIFKQQTIKDFIQDNAANFDFLVISDVMHHVPWTMHEDLLRDAGKTLRQGGYLILKDWERSSTPIHALCYFCDRYITGDLVRYKTTDEFRELIKSIFGENSIQSETKIRPWTNNIVFLILPEL